MNEEIYCNLERVCRTCLQTPKELINIFDKKSKDEKSIINKISDCTTVKVEEADNLPMNICKNCLDKLNTAYEFKIMVIESDKALHKIFNKKQSQKSLKPDKDGIKKEEIPENVETTNNENIESDVRDTMELPLERNEDCLDICGDANDVSDKECTSKEAKTNEDIGMDDTDSSIKSMDTENYDNLKNTSSWSDKRDTEKGFVCEICWKRYSDYSGLYGHSFLHKPHACMYCKKQFESEEVLRLHITIHTGDT